MIKNIASTSFKCKHCALHFAYGYSKLSPFSISESRLDSNLKAYRP